MIGRITEHNVTYETADTMSTAIFSLSDSERGSASRVFVFLSREWRLPPSTNSVTISRRFRLDASSACILCANVFVCMGEIRTKDIHAGTGAHEPNIHLRETRKKYIKIGEELQDRICTQLSNLR